MLICRGVKLPIQTCSYLAWRPVKRNARNCGVFFDRKNRCALCAAHLWGCGFVFVSSTWRSFFWGAGWKRRFFFKPFKISMGLQFLDPADIMTMIFSHHRFARGFVGSGYIFVNEGTQQESSRVEDLFRILNLMRRPVFFGFQIFTEKKSEDLIFCTQNNLQKKKYNNHHQSNPRFDEFFGEEEQFFVCFGKKHVGKKGGGSVWCQI